MISDLNLHDLIGKKVKVTRKAGDSWVGTLESDGNHFVDGSCSDGKQNAKVVIRIKAGVTISFRLEEVESVKAVKGEMKA